VLERMMTPDTKYASSGGINIAYQVIGDGPIDLVLVPGWVSNIEVFWEEPNFARFLRGLSSFTRLILFDKRGTGLSDRVVDASTLEQRMDDVRAVLDAVGSKRAALLGYSEGGPMCALFAATYPERTSALIMMGGYASRLRTPGYPFGPTPEQHEAWLAKIASDWGSPIGLEVRAPTLADDLVFRQWWAHYLRASCSPAAALALTKANGQIDIRHILPSIQVPTLILHASGDRVVEIGHAHYLVEHIPGAKLILIDSEDHLPFASGSAAIVSSIREFITGHRHEHQSDTVLSTILFTDIVGSTEKLIAAGDRQWTDLLEAHNFAVRRELAAFRGREVNTTGDGFVAIFDGPARAVRCAFAVKEAVRRVGIEIRSGIHTGECEMRRDSISGVSVHIAARIASLASASNIVVSRTVKDLVGGSGISFDDLGDHMLKGVPDPWRLYQVVSPGQG
jgi:pimeloyl-ACP methyl ester carboxylesterase/class 3 adenylate cyclase